MPYLGGGVHFSALVYGIYSLASWGSRCLKVYNKRVTRRCDHVGSWAGPHRRQQEVLRGCFCVSLFFPRCSASLPPSSSSSWLFSSNLRIKKISGYLKISTTCIVIDYIPKHYLWNFPRRKHNIPHSLHKSFRKWKISANIFFPFKLQTSIQPKYKRLSYKLLSFELPGHGFQNGLTV